MKNYISLSILILINSICYSQDWEKTYGGGLTEDGFSVQQTADSGFIALGSTNSFGQGATDYFLVKTNASGDTLWTKTYGGIYGDRGRSVKQTIDGGYIIAGESNSFSITNDNIYLIKTDANGNTLWTKSIGTNEQEFCGSVVQTIDNGFCIAGSTGNVSNGNSKVYLIKTNLNGDTLWTKTFGRAGINFGYSMQQTLDSGFIISGASYNQANSKYETCLIKTNSIGDTLWTKYFTSNNNSYGESVIQTMDGGYIIGGTTGENFNAIKTDQFGNVQWLKEIDKGETERCQSIIQTNDLGYLMAGVIYKISDLDILIIKLDNLGNESWSKRIGGSLNEDAYMIQPVVKGGFVLVGSKYSMGTNDDLFMLKSKCDNFPEATISVLDTICFAGNLASTLSTMPQFVSTYQWIKNDSIIPNAISTNEIFSDEGIYSLIITNIDGCSNNSNEISINFPKPYFQIYPKTACPLDLVKMGDWGNSSDIYSSYTWDFGDGTSDTGRIASHIYLNTGTYVISRTVNAINGSCSAYTDTVTITNSAIPPVDFDLLINSVNPVNNVACPGDKIEFIPYAYSYWFISPPPFDATSYFWDFGDGITDTSKFPIHYYNTDGSYTITLTVTNHCGNDNSISGTILISSGLTSTINPNFTWKDTQGVLGSSVSPCEQITFQSMTGITYSWSFGDGNTTTTSSNITNHSYNTNGTYNVVLIVINGCGLSDTATKVITVNGICTGINTNLTSQNNIISIYPNPFNKFAKIKINDFLKDQNYGFHIYNLQGKEVNTFKVTSSEFDIDGTSLKAGMYFYFLTKKNEKIASGKLIKSQ